VDVFFKIYPSEIKDFSATPTALVEMTVEAVIIMIRKKGALSTLN